MVNGHGLMGVEATPGMGRYCGRHRQSQCWAGAVAAGVGKASAGHAAGAGVRHWGRRGDERVRPG